ncbi:MAG: hypothetical protein HZB39_05250 [Planctomycetes bacterium]|nr:hypothetical protein [Planctomycetota bacterium]
MLGAIVLLAAGSIDVAHAWPAIDASTIGLLFGLMVVSGQLQLAGFYSAIALRLASARVGPRGLLAALVLVAGGLSAVLQNDVICLAMPPLLIDVCRRRRLDPMPFLLALAAAANVGSAATLIAPLPRDVAALAAAGILLVSRTTSSRALLAAVDVQLLLLFVGLFVVHAAFTATGLPARALDGLAARGVDLGATPWLFGATLVLSNVVSNVPAVMLLLPAAHGAGDGYLLALVSTFAGNLLLVGSIANLIVVTESERLGVRPRDRSWFLEHLRYGLPVTAVTMAAAAASCALLPV